MFHDVPNPVDQNQQVQQGVWRSSFPIFPTVNGLLLRVLLDELRQTGALDALEGLQLAVLVAGQRLEVEKTLR